MKKKIIWSIVVLFLIAGSIIGYYGYQIIFKPNVEISAAEAKKKKDKQYLYIPTGSNFSDVTRILREKEFIKDTSTFIWLAKKMNYHKNVRPGRYLVLNNMTNRELISMLRQGKQTAVRLTFNNIKTLKQLSGRIGQQIEADSVKLLAMLSDPVVLKEYDFDSLTINCMFIPNTYEMYWNTSEKAFLNKMYKEYKKFWNNDRLAKAKKAKLTPNQVVTLASIVQAEQANYNDEKPVVAGLYINRLHINMLLQADPTVIYAIGDFTIKRLYDDDKKIDSPYNTYKYTGLPPGPINLPEIVSIDAVLNYAKHEYIYMCAKEDFSGRHNFSKTFPEHTVYANKYRRALSDKGVFR
jgi:UPF0755 protein